LSLISKALAMVFSIQMIIRLTIQSSPINIANSKQMPVFPSMHSWKTLRKELLLLSHCNSFDQLALQSLNDYNLFLVLPAEILKFWGLVIYCWKGLENTFPTSPCLRANSISYWQYVARNGHCVATEEFSRNQQSHFSAVINHYFLTTLMQ
jgi:hypothetical protein